MVIAAFDPVMTGFEQPMTMSPAGQLAAYNAQMVNSGSTEPVPQLLGAGLGAGAGVLGIGELTKPPDPNQLGNLGVGALSALGLAIPEPITTVLGIAGAAYLGAQALGLGEGGGLFGNNLLGGDTSMIPGTPIQLGGPGLAEPGPGTGWLLLKEWHVNYDWGRLQYYRIQKVGSRGKNSNIWIAVYNTRTKQWKAWRWVQPRLAVIGKNMPRHQMLTRLRRNLSRHSADARTLLKITSPHSLAKPKRRYYKRR